MSQETHSEIILELESVKKELKTLKVISTCILIMVFLLQIQNLVSSLTGSTRVITNLILKTINSFRERELRYLLDHFREEYIQQREREYSEEG